MKIDRWSLINGLSYAQDAAEKSYLSHSKHVAYMSMLLAQELHLSNEQTEETIMAALLHDIGSGNLYDMGDHCLKGQKILSALPIPTAIPEIVLYHHEKYDGSGPFGLEGEAIPIQSQLICLADMFDKGFGATTQVNMDLFKAVNNWLHTLRDLFGPRVREAFLQVIQREHVFLTYFGRQLELYLEWHKGCENVWLDYEDIRKFANAFSTIIDNRSPYTHEHSQGIAQLVAHVTEGMGYSEEIQQEMHIAALLHDIGKLAIEIEIIDKQGPLNQEERYEINKHTYYTRWILEKINGFERIVEYASNHHEKLNGRGYPYHLEAEAIGELDRIMTVCDIYKALTEDRPYRDKLKEEEIWQIIGGMVDRGELDRDLVERMKTLLLGFVLI